MRKKKILAIILVAILSLSCLTGCSDKGKEDMNNKLNNKTTETTKKDDSKADNKTSESDKTESKSDTETKKDDSKADDKTSESTTDNKSDSASKPSEDKKSDSNSGNTGSNSSANKPSNGNSKSDSSTSKPSQSTEKPAETKPAHQHTWVDHTATKQVPRTVHHDAVYETVTVPAVTKTQIQCMGCGQWFDNNDELAYHAFTSPVNSGCGATAAHEREVVITPAHTEQKLVKEAYDETVYDTQTYVDYRYCSECGQHQ